MPRCLAGDLAVLGAAVGYSLATVRLEAWTSRLGTLQLAWAKSSGIAGAPPDYGSERGHLAVAAERAHLLAVLLCLAWRAAAAASSSTPLLDDLLLLCAARGETAAVRT